MGSAAWALLAIIVVIGGSSLLWFGRDVRTAVFIEMAAHGALSISIFVALGLWAPDAERYDLVARETVEYWRTGATHSIVGAGKEGFPYLLAAIYKLVGHAPQVGLAVNWLAHGWLVILIAGLARQLQLPVRATALLAALFPPILFWGSLLLREAITWLLIVIVLRGVVAICREVTIRNAAPLLVGLSALLWFRATAAVLVFAASVPVILFAADKKFRWQRVGVCGLGCAILATRWGGLRDQVEVAAEQAGSALNSQPDVLARQGPTSGFTGRLPGALRVLAGPLPWEWPHLNVAFVADAICWVGLVVLVGIGLWRGWTRSRTLFPVLLLPALALLAALSVTSSNYGTMQRLRVQAEVVLLPIAALGFPQTLRRRLGDETVPRVTPSNEAKRLPRVLYTDGSEPGAGPES